MSEVRRERRRGRVRGCKRKSVWHHGVDCAQLHRFLAHEAPLARLLELLFRLLFKTGSKNKTLAPSELQPRLLQSSPRQGSVGFVSKSRHKPEQIKHYSRLQ